MNALVERMYPVIIIALPALDLVRSRYWDFAFACNSDIIFSDFPTQSTPPH